MKALKFEHYSSNLPSLIKINKETLTRNLSIIDPDDLDNICRNIAPQSADICSLPEGILFLLNDHFVFVTTDHINMAKVNTLLSRHIKFLTEARKNKSFPTKSLISSRPIIDKSIQNKLMRQLLSLSAQIYECEQEVYKLPKFCHDNVTIYDYFIVHPKGLYTTYFYTDQNLEIRFYTPKENYLPTVQISLASTSEILPLNLLPELSEYLTAYRFKEYDTCITLILAHFGDTHA